MSGHIRRILVCSATGLDARGNIVSVGDEALVDALTEALEAKLPGVFVERTLNTRAAPTAETGDRVPAHSLLAVAAAVRRADLIVLGGGTLFQEDVKPSWRMPIAGLVRFMTFVVGVASLTRTPVAVFGVGAEHLGGGPTRWAVRRILRAARIASARDASSADLLASLSGEPVSVGADTMFLSDVTLPSREETDGRPIAVSLREDAPRALIDHLAVWLQTEAKNVPVMLVPMDRRPASDTAALRQLEDILGSGRCEWVAPEADWTEVFARVSTASLCIGMRLHFAIFAALAGVPSVVLTSLPKTVSFCVDAGLQALSVDANRDEVFAALAAVGPPQSERLAALSDRGDRALEDLIACM